MDRRQRLIEIFGDTQKYYVQNVELAKAVSEAKAATRLYQPEEYPERLTTGGENCMITVTKNKSFEAAMKIRKEYPDWKITVLNFASATNPGGGVKTGSSAQEEILCRCSTLYPTLTQDWLWKQYYLKNRNAHDNLHNDVCIYSPGVVICKTDEAWPERMEEKDWVKVDVISCAAPNLRKRSGNYYNPEHGLTPEISAGELYTLHKKRAEHILHVAAANHAHALVLGAFGCGAFANDPNVVARAYKDAMVSYTQYFRMIEFAVYCRQDETDNYDAFKKIIMR